MKKTTKKSAYSSSPPQRVKALATLEIKNISRQKKQERTLIYSDLPPKGAQAFAILEIERIARKQKEKERKKFLRIFGFFFYIFLLTSWKIVAYQQSMLNYTAVGTDKELMLSTCESHIKRLPEFSNVSNKITLKTTIKRNIFYGVWILGMGESQPHDIRKRVSIKPNHERIATIYCGITVSSGTPAVAAGKITRSSKVGDMAIGVLNIEWENNNFNSKDDNAKE